jgi:2-polyprenyl-3-methyl-5-hydroxy-6-metoxy-1,4-benzoquinol methylase
VVGLIKKLSQLLESARNVGCGGILADPMARKGANVLGRSIDQSLKVAELQLEAQTEVKYREISVQLQST